MGSGHARSSGRSVGVGQVAGGVPGESLQRRVGLGQGLGVPRALSRHPPPLHRLTLPFPNSGRHQPCLDPQSLGSQPLHPPACLSRDPDPLNCFRRPNAPSCLMTLPQILPSLSWKLLCPTRPHLSGVNSPVTSSGEASCPCPRKGGPVACPSSSLHYLYPQGLSLLTSLPASSCGPSKRWTKPQRNGQGTGASRRQLFAGPKGRFLPLLVVSSHHRRYLRSIWATFCQGWEEAVRVSVAGRSSTSCGPYPHLSLGFAAPGRGVRAPLQERGPGFR